MPVHHDFPLDCETLIPVFGHCLRWTPATADFTAVPDTAADLPAPSCSCWWWLPGPSCHGADDSRTATRLRRHNDGRARHQFRASLREPQRGGGIGGKLTGELRRKLDAAQLVIDLHRQRAAGTTIRHELRTAGRLGRDPGRTAKPRVNPTCNAMMCSFHLPRGWVTTRRMQLAG
ncbi:MAG: hypothetical protein ACRDRU_24200 [Pseudonocardiaceae bacterium]